MVSEKLSNLEVMTKANVYWDGKVTSRTFFTADVGGLEDIIKPGYKVIIKSNLVACPTEGLSGGVTRWEVCFAIYEAVKAVGGVPVIAESSAAGADTELTIAKCGYQELRDKGIPVIDLKQKENARCTVDIENGVVFNKINT